MFMYIEHFETSLSPDLTGSSLYIISNIWQRVQAALDLTSFQPIKFNVTNVSYEAWNFRLQANVVM